MKSDILILNGQIIYLPTSNRPKPLEDDGAYAEDED